MYGYYIYLILPIALHIDTDTLIAIWNHKLSGYLFKLVAFLALVANSIVKAYVKVKRNRNSNLVNSTPLLNVRRHVVGHLTFTVSCWYLTVAAVTPAFENMWRNCCWPRRWVESCFFFLMTRTLTNCIDITLPRRLWVWAVCEFSFLFIAFYFAANNKQKASSVNALVCVCVSEWVWMKRDETETRRPSYVRACYCCPVKSGNAALILLYSFCLLLYNLPQLLLLSGRIK